MIPNFKSVQEVKTYCSKNLCSDCGIKSACEQFRRSASLIENLEKVFIHYRKAKLEKLLK